HEPPAPSPSATAENPADDAAPAGAATNPQVAIVKSRRPPTDDDRQPNNLIQSDDPAVVEMAQAVAPEETDHAKLAVELEKHVKRSITMKNFSQAFSTAAEVAKRREGDCTEHAVLLAGLARARGIPARVAIGLI